MEAIGHKIEAGITKAYAKTDFKTKSWGSMFNQGYVIEYLRSTDTPLPYMSEEEFYKSEDLPLVSDLEAKLRKLQS